MCRTFAGRVSTVVTAHTIAGNVDVIEIGRHPGHRAVAVITIVAAHNVRRMLARRDNAIVAGGAAAQNLGVVDCDRRRPHVSRMTIFANGSGQDMCLTFSARIGPVVTGTATANDLRMIDRNRRCPGIARMTIFANHRCLYMRSILACCIRAVVAATAVVDNVGVIKQCGCPRNCAMAIVAGIRACDVGRMFTDCGDAVVA